MTSLWPFRGWCWFMPLQWTQYGEGGRSLRLCSRVSASQILDEQPGPFAYTCSLQSVSIHRTFHTQLLVGSPQTVYGQQLPVSVGKKGMLTLPNPSDSSVRIEKSKTTKTTTKNHRKDESLRSPPKDILKPAASSGSFSKDRQGCEWPQCLLVIGSDL